MKLAIATALITVLPFAIANADRPGGPGGRPPAPPQEAFTACASAKQGDTCTVTLRDHTMTGTCETAPDSSALACRPPHPPGPPPEAIAACSSAKEGDSCTVTFGDHTVTGTCAKGPDSSKPLACRPEGAPPPPR